MAGETAQHEISFAVGNYPRIEISRATCESMLSLSLSIVCVVSPDPCAVWQLGYFAWRSNSNNQTPILQREQSSPLAEGTSHWSWSLLTLTAFETSWCSTLPFHDTITRHIYPPQRTRNSAVMLWIIFALAENGVPGSTPDFIAYLEWAIRSRTSRCRFLPACCLGRTCIGIGIIGEKWTCMLEPIACKPRPSSKTL